MTQSLAAVTWVTKSGGALVGACSVGSFVLSFSGRAPDIPSLSLLQQLNTALHLGILTAIAHGILWSVAELIMKSNFGAGGHGRLPQGSSAVILSLSLTLPLVAIPALYSFFMGLPILPHFHWAAAPFVVLLGAAAHLILYGTGKHSFIGLRHRIMPPTQRKTPWRTAFAMESLYAIMYFGLIVLPYRIIVEAPTPTFASTLVARSILPAIGFFAAMVVLIMLRPSTVRDRPGIEMRGVLSGIFLPFFLCAGMFV